MTPDISIIVCTHNRAAMLREAVASLSDLATEGRFTYEIVVIDNASTDHTHQIISAAALCSKNPLRAFLETKKGIVPARNRGIHEAEGQWIAFFDDDQLADARWLLELVRGATEKQCRVVGGSVHLALQGTETLRLDPTVRMLLGEAIHSEEPLPYGGRLTPGCGNLMIERTVFDQVGLFERTVDGRGEDTDLFSRIERAGIVAWYIPSAIIHHITPPERLAPAYLFNLAHRMGEGVALRQFSQLSRRRFALLWLAKALRLLFMTYPHLAFAVLTGNRSASLGRRCLVALNTRFLGTSLRLLRRTASQQQVAKSVPCPLTPVP